MEKFRKGTKESDMLKIFWWGVWNFFLIFFLFLLFDPRKKLNLFFMTPQKLKSLFRILTFELVQKTIAPVQKKLYWF